MVVGWISWISGEDWWTWKDCAVIIECHTILVGNGFDLDQYAIIIILSHWSHIWQKLCLRSVDSQ